MAGYQANPIRGGTRADLTGALPWRDGPAFIEGFGHALALELRGAQVARFAADSETWLESGPRVRVASDEVTCAAERLVLRWTVEDLNDTGENAIRQDYRFEGRLRGTVAEGTLDVHVVANFLKPAVVLAKSSGPARLVLGTSAAAATA